ncbi:MAG: MerR family transcriptional regulator [Bacillota bacterium]
MKISEFANEFGVSNDTVRYYMELNLLTPQKKGGHYFYDKKCKSQMEDLLELKEMGFSLKEIKNIFHFKRMGKLTTYQKNKYYQQLYQDKAKEIKKEIKNMEEAKKKLNKKIMELKAKDKKNNIRIGIDLSVLSLFNCPNCNNELKLSAQKVKENQVLEGSLTCRCGESLQIKDGIIYSKNYENKSEMIEENHIEDYIKNTDSDFIDKSYESLEWLTREFKNQKITNKIIMEPGSGYGHFLRHIYDDLAEDTVYICIDNDPNLNKLLKKLLENTGEKKNIIFITAELPEIPIKENYIDVLVDFTGTSDYSFHNEDFLPESLDFYMKEEAVYLASFIIYERFGPNSVVSLPYRQNFNYKNIKNKILDLNFEINKEYKSEIVKIKKTFGKYEDFAQVGDQLYSYQLKAVR